MKNLFDETTLVSVALRNRAWRSATWLGLAGRNGEITDDIIRNIRAGVNECSFLPAAEALAAIVKTPVVLVGGVRSLETANAVLAKTAIQYIALSRPLIREPNLINRWQAGDIRPSTCVSCNACYRTSAHACLFAANKANATLKSRRLS